MRDGLIDVAIDGGCVVDVHQDSSALCSTPDVSGGAGGGRRSSLGEIGPRSIGNAVISMGPMGDLSIKLVDTAPLLAIEGCGGVCALRVIFVGVSHISSRRGAGPDPFGRGFPPGAQDPVNPLFEWGLEYRLLLRAE